MTAVDGRDTPSLTTRSAAVTRFCLRWAEALTGSGQVTGTLLEIVGELRPLTVRLARAVRITPTRSGVADDELAGDVAAVLLRRGRGSMAVIGPTVVTLIDGFAAEFDDGSDRLGLPRTVLRERVVAFAGAVAEGFARAVREQALRAQEEMQRAALAAVRTARAGRRTSEARFRALFAQTVVGIGLVDMAGRVIDSNAAWGAMMGYAVAEMRGRSVIELVTPGGSAPAMRCFGELLAGTREHFRMDIAHCNRQGERLYLDLSISKVRTDDGGPDFLVGVAIDISERKRLEGQLWHESRHDALTGLPNRTLFFERLDDALGRQQPIGICYLDLDGFKIINDSLGHDVGDRLLVQVAGRLTGATAELGSLLARLGGDEFGVLTNGTDLTNGTALTDGTHPTDGTDPGDQADRILAALAGPIVIDGRRLTISASVGVVDSATSTDADELMRAADLALYAAKAAGRACWRRPDPRRSEGRDG